MKLTVILFGLMTLITSSVFAESQVKAQEKAWGEKINLTEAVSLDDAIKALPQTKEILVQSWGGIGLTQFVKSGKLCGVSM